MKKVGKIIASFLTISLAVGVTHITTVADGNTVVYPVKELKIDNSDENLYLAEGDVFDLKWTVEPKKTASQDVIFSLSQEPKKEDETVITIDTSGQINAIHTGTATIKVISKEDKEKAFTIHVEVFPLSDVTKISFAKQKSYEIDNGLHVDKYLYDKDKNIIGVDENSRILGEYGDSYSLVARALVNVGKENETEGQYNKNIVWESSDPEYASVSTKDGIGKVNIVSNALETKPYKGFFEDELDENGNKTGYKVKYYQMLNSAKFSVEILARLKYTHTKDGRTWYTYSYAYDSLNEEEQKDPKNKPSNGGVAMQFIVTITEPEGNPVFRMYNPNSGEHFYTFSKDEVLDLIKNEWLYEGIGFFAINRSENPVYRLYNPNAGEHHYTLSEKEKDFLVSVGWKDEGIGWYSISRGKSQETAMQRLYNPNAFANNHHYTIGTDDGKKERNFLLMLGWRAEGIGWYGTVNNYPHNHPENPGFDFELPNAVGHRPPSAMPEGPINL